MKKKGLQLFHKHRWEAGQGGVGGDGAEVKGYAGAIFACTRSSGKVTGEAEEEKKEREERDADTIGPQSRDVSAIRSFPAGPEQ